MNETEIVIQMQQGKEEAFDLLFDTYKNKAFRLAYLISGSYTDSEDIVQEAFIKYWRQENNFNDEIALKTYLYKSIRNGCLNQLRHENVRKKYFESLPDDWESEDYFMENVIKEEVANIVLQEINKLSETSRKILFKALDGYSNEEIAEELGVSVNTVKTHKARSYIMLRQNLGHLRVLLFLLF